MLAGISRATTGRNDSYCSKGRSGITNKKEKISSFLQLVNLKGNSKFKSFFVRPCKSIENQSNGEEDFLSTSLLQVVATICSKSASHQD